MKGVLFGVLLLALSSTQCRAQTDSAEVYDLLDTIVGMGIRNYEDTAVLNGVGNFIYETFEEYSDSVYRQKYTIGRREYFNVGAFVGDPSKPRIVIGAHYDVCGTQDGADDNGSGVVGLIVALKNLKNYVGDYCLEFIAYTLEEPPLYATEYMGSYIHANRLKEENTDVYGMISLEMLAYFKDEKKTQRYPLGILKLIYGGKGDFITLVRTFQKGKFVKTFCRKFKKSKQVKTKKFTGPKKLTGIDFSDHRSYWALGIDAMMITDTSFYRNANYHQETDTMGTLDYHRFAAVVNGVIHALEQF